MPKLNRPSTVASKDPADEDGVITPIEVTRSITGPTQSLLWGRAAGRCEFSGCNRLLGQSVVTQEQVNVAEKAHIYAFSADGPRGNDGVSAEMLNSVDNLMLVCHDCHRTIDQRRDGGRYSVDRLQKMKHDHEQRVEIATGIDVDRRSHVLLFGTNVGEHSSPLKFGDAAEAMFPDRYPAERRAVVLGTHNNPLGERDAAFWTTESESLRRFFNLRVRERLAIGEIGHLSVFAFAPQPLLVLLGTLLGDIVQADIYQLQ